MTAPCGRGEILGLLVFGEFGQFLAIDLLDALPVGFASLFDYHSLGVLARHHRGVVYGSSETSEVYQRRFAVDVGEESREHAHVTYGETCVVLCDLLLDVL